MKYPIALFCSLCMLLLWVACDSQGGIDQECLGDVTLLSALEDTTAYVGESLTLALGGDHLPFKQTAGRHMTYAADSDDSFVNVEIADRAVQVRDCLDFPSQKKNPRFQLVLAYVDWNA